MLCYVHMHVLVLTCAACTFVSMFYPLCPPFCPAGMPPGMMGMMMRPGMIPAAPGMMPGVNPQLAGHPAFAAAYQQQLLQQQLMQQQMAMQVRAYTVPCLVCGVEVGAHYQPLSAAASKLPLWLLQASTVLNVHHTVHVHTFADNPCVALVECCRLPTPSAAWRWVVVAMVRHSPRSARARREMTATLTR